MLYISKSLVDQMNRLESGMIISDKDFKFSVSLFAVMLVLGLIVGLRRPALA